VSARSASHTHKHTHTHTRARAHARTYARALSWTWRRGLGEFTQCISHTDRPARTRARAHTQTHTHTHARTHARGLGDVAEVSARSASHTQTFALARTGADASPRTHKRALERTHASAHEPTRTHSGLHYLMRCRRMCRIVARGRVCLRGPRQGLLAWPAAGSACVARGRVCLRGPRQVRGHPVPHGGARAGRHPLHPRGRCSPAIRSTAQCSAPVRARIGTSGRACSELLAPPAVAQAQHFDQHRPRHVPLRRPRRQNVRPRSLPAAPRAQALEHACAALTFALRLQRRAVQHVQPVHAVLRLRGRLVPDGTSASSHEATPNNERRKSNIPMRDIGQGYINLAMGAVRCSCMWVVRRQPDTWAHMRVHSHACTHAQVLLLREHMLSFPHEHVQCKSLHRPDQPISQFKSISDQSEYRTPHELIVGAEL
jgi:hypothetical protein